MENYSPLSSACVRSLTDKMYDKRKAAAVEIEKMVKEFAAVNNVTQIKKLIQVLKQDFALSRNANYKRGGVIGLAAVAVALGKDARNYTEDLILPILANFGDPDTRIRYYAGEGLYNVIKMIRGDVLIYFSSVFETLSKLAADPDQNCKNALELLDRLMKDIVTEQSAFDLEGFIPLLRERMYSTDPFACQFIISWVAVLADVPHINFVGFLPEILDGLLRMLEGPQAEIKRSCECVLIKFMRSIKNDPACINFSEMINILVIHAQSNDITLQETALQWIKEFTNLYGVRVFPYLSGILVSILPCLAFENELLNNVKETAKAINFNLIHLLSIHAEIDNNEEDSSLDLLAVVEVLSKYLKCSSVDTKIAVLNWIYALHQKYPLKFFPYVEDRLFALLMETVSDPSDKVVTCDLKVLSTLVAFSKEAEMKEKDGKRDVFFNKIVNSLLALFKEKDKLLEEKGYFIVKHMCVLLDAEDLYEKFAASLLEEKNNLKFASSMVQRLNLILITSEELSPLRSKLKNYQKLENKDGERLFEILFKAWCHDAIAPIALCLLTQNFELALLMVDYVGNQVEIGVELLIQVDNLVHLIESPMLSFVRYKLLNDSGYSGRRGKNHTTQGLYLIRALSGLLMILPQSKAFYTLKERLEISPISKEKVSNLFVDPSFCKIEQDISNLLRHFESYQSLHQKYRLEKALTAISDISTQVFQSLSPSSNEANSTTM